MASESNILSFVGQWYGGTEVDFEFGGGTVTLSLASDKIFFFE